MSIASPTATIGDLLRDWRQRRHLSQLDLALEADVSARHLSFVETGRSRPSRDLVVDLAERLEVPLRERNALLLAAGYAPIYRETPLETAEMSPIREVLDRLLAGHEPFPAVVFDRHWDVVSLNKPMLSLSSEGVSPELLTPPINAMRVALHPDGMSSRITNFAEYGAHLLEQLRRQALLTGDPVIAGLEKEVRGYPGVSDAPPELEQPSPLFVPLNIRVTGQEMSFFNTLTTFGTALDITMAELTIEALYPADEATAAAVRAAWGGTGLKGQDGLMSGKA
jgi:transcriptional regulator with XRE-family HTH domain